MTLDPLCNTDHNIGLDGSQIDLLHDFVGNFFVLSETDLTRHRAGLRKEEQWLFFFPCSRAALGPRLVQHLITASPLCIRALLPLSLVSLWVKETYRGDSLKIELLKADF